VLRTTKSRAATLICGCALALGAASPAFAQTQQDGLVNVNVEGVDVLVPISVAANLCDVNVAALARQEREEGAECDATAESLASPGPSQGGDGAQQEGLVNVNIQDVEVLVPVSVAANLCNANVALLAEQVREGGATCTATAESLASPGPGQGPANSPGRQD
jgi:hypothetical protein